MDGYIEKQGSLFLSKIRSNASIEGLFMPLSFDFTLNSKNTSQLFIVLFLSLSTIAFSQEITSVEDKFNPVLCNISSSQLSWQFEYVNREGLPQEMDIHIRQTPHLLVAQVIKSDKKEIYVFKDNEQYVELGDYHVPRQLALHHLRERVMESPLMIEDFKILRSRSFFCPRSQTQDSLFLKDSLITYSNVKPLLNKHGYQLYDWRNKSWKKWHIKAYSEYFINKKKVQIPNYIDVEDEYNWGRLTMTALRVNRKEITIIIEK